MVNAWATLESAWSVHSAAQYHADTTAAPLSDFGYATPGGAGPSAVTMSVSMEVIEPEEVQAIVEMINQPSTPPASNHPHAYTDAFGNTVIATVPRYRRGKVVGSMGVVGGAYNGGGLDELQTSLDVAGLTPGAGILPDAANTIISLLRGNWGDAGMNGLAMIPIIGQTTKGGQLTAKGLSHLDEAAATLKHAPKGGAGQIADQIAGPGQRLAGQIETIANMRAFVDRMRDVSANPGKWNVIRSVTEPSSAIRNRGGTSLQELLRNEETGETIVRHTLFRPDGSIFDPAHFRDIWK